MQRISIQKNEAVADLIERILETQDREIVLIIPKDSHLMDSPSNFRLIAREAGVLAKDISVESVDEDVLAHAKAAGLRASHPLFDHGANGAAIEGQSLSDIVPRGRGKKAVPEKVEKKLKVKVAHPTLEEAKATLAAAAGSKDDLYDAGMDHKYSGGAENGGEEMSAAGAAGASHDHDRGRGGDLEEERYDTLEDSPRRGWGRKALVWGIVALLVIGGAMWLTAYAFGRATVTVNFQKTLWEYTGTVNAAVAAKNVDAAANTIPAELAEPAQTLTKSFPATGRTTGGAKAHATLTIVNAYGAEPQELVATTRFETPDGKIYRLDSGTVVPGAKVEDGKVAASSTIKVPVTADKPGPEYNISPVAHLNIPGFKNTPKYAGFYGILPGGASGGSNTGGAVPTETDIKNAKAALAGGLDDSFQATFLASVPADFKILPGATAMATTTYMVSQAVDENGNFTVTASTVFRAFEFRERDLADLLNRKAQAQGGEGKELQGLAVEYRNVSPSFSRKQMTFTADAKGTLAPAFDQAAFAASVAGKSRDGAREALLGLPDLVDAKVSLWPAWLWMLPDEPSKIKVVVE